MRVPRSMWSLETLGRVRLSRHFYMREFLYSEIANFYGLQNIPEDPDLAIQSGQAFCQTLLDPLEDTFGRVAVRSGYRWRGPSPVQVPHECTIAAATEATHVGQSRQPAG